MKKLLVFLLIIPTPALAGSFYPNIYGTRYCELRAMGIPASEARPIAMKEAWSDSRHKEYVTYNGKPMSLDVIIAAKHVTEYCPD